MHDFELCSDINTYIQFVKTKPNTRVVSWMATNLARSFGRMQVSDCQIGMVVGVDACGVYQHSIAEQVSESLNRTHLPMPIPETTRPTIICGSEKALAWSSPPTATTCTAKHGRLLPTDSISGRDDDKGPQNTPDGVRRHDLSLQSDTWMIELP